MKKMIGMLIVIGMIAVSCKKNFLDPKVVNVLTTEEGTFSDSARTIQFVNGLYINTSWAVKIGSRYNGNGNLAGAVDEAVNNDQSASNQANLINQATMTPSNIGAGSSLNASDDRGYWLVYWTPIRGANIALKNIPNSPLPDMLKRRLMGEARFLRAFYYSTMLKYYGGLPLIGDEIFTPDSPPMLSRSSFQATVNYIVSELDAATDLLYDQNQVIRDNKNAQIFDGPGIDAGRATKGTCMAVKARVLLYAASPLFNGGNIAADLGGGHPELTGYTNFDKQRWRSAADAAEAVIASNQYALRVDNTTEPGFGFYSVFVTRPIQPTPEFIFYIPMAPSKDREMRLDPPSRGGASGTSPYQGLVDAFPMRNGKVITDPTSGYDPNNPYANRDPRLDNSIQHNESLRFLQSAGTRTKLFTYFGSGPDGYNNGVGGTTKTGYYVMKTLDRNVTNAGSPTSQRCDPIIRYAEIILSAAEAVNEYDGPTQRVYQLLGQIRNRAGILPGTDGLYGIPAGITQAAMRTIIQNERRIELAFEDHRIWDIHRWKIGEQAMNRAQYGVKIELKTGGGYTYTPVVANNTVWRTRLYLFPFNQFETQRNTNLIQNPGW